MKCFRILLVRSKAFFLFGNRDKDNASSVKGSDEDEIGTNSDIYDHDQFFKKYIAVFKI